MSNKKIGEAGQSLMEILIASTIVVIIFGGVAALIFVGLRASRQSQETSLAQSLIQDTSTALRGLVFQDWHSIWGSSGLVSYFSLDEGSESRVYEPVNGNNGTINLGSVGNTSLAAAWQASGNCKAGQCLSFDGTDDYISAPDSSSLRLTAYSVTVWVYPQVDDEYWNGIVGKPGRNYNIWLGNSNAASDSFVHHRFHTTTNTNNGCPDASGVVKNQWNFIVITNDGTTCKTYINGSLTTSGTLGESLVVDNTSLIIGRNLDGGSDGTFSGRIDEVRIYNRALSDQDVSSLYNGVSKLYPKNVSGIWLVKEGEETINFAGVDYIRSYYFSAVQRDSSGNIVSSGGSDDPSTKKVRYTVRWGSRTVSGEEYITRSGTRITIQTDWSGGSGEESPVLFTTTRFSTSSNITNSTIGEIRLDSASTVGSLTSSIFDTGVSGGAVINNIIWQGTQPSGTFVQLQLASGNSASGLWTYIGPDGTSSTYYQPSSPNVPVSVEKRFHFNHRYLRYKVILNPSAGNTPTVKDISLNWSP